MGWFSSSKPKNDSKPSYPTANAGYPTQEKANFQAAPPANAPPGYTHVDAQSAQGSVYPTLPPTGQNPGYAAQPGVQQPGYPQAQAYPTAVQNSYPQAQQPYPSQPGPNSVYAQPTPAHVTNQYNIVYQPPPVQQARFDSGARFDGNTPARIPPPPPGVAANSAQLAAANGQGVQVSQKKAGFWSGGDGGGVSVMGGGLF